MQKEKLNRKNKGITLIALVITIIVMLILVGVTISVSLNGGLFSTAKEATEETQIAQEREQLLVAAMGALGEDGKVDLEKLDSNLPEGFEKTGEGTYKSSTGNTFTVGIDGTIALVGSSSEEEPEIPATITLSTTEINKEITSGTPESVELTATLNNASGDLTWESSDGDVAEISGEGTTRTITLKKAGTATITVSYGDVSITCSITVTEKQAVVATNKLNGITIDADLYTSSTPYQHSYEFAGKTLTSVIFNFVDGSSYHILYSGNGNVAEISIEDSDTAILTIRQPLTMIPPVATTNEELVTIEFTFSDGTTDNDTFIVKYSD